MLEALLNRSSCREFNTKTIEKDKVELLKKLINSSPTAMNSQDFRAVFVTSKDIKEKFKSYNWDQPHVVDCPLIIVFLTDSTSKFNDVDALIATGLLTAGATELGLSTCIIGGIAQHSDDVINLLKVDNKYKVTMGLCVGYSDAKSSPKEPVNKVL
ncbi:MAG: nitroreductase family protein [Mycoplasmataceae bacterium]|nr:nitroreductase family protein [Mycoplasmataceae bacterium]